MIPDSSRRAGWDGECHGTGVVLGYVNRKHIAPQGKNSVCLFFPGVTVAVQGFRPPKGTLGKKSINAMVVN